MRKKSKVTTLDFAVYIINENITGNEYIADLKRRMEAKDPDVLDDIFKISEEIDKRLENSTPKPERGLEGDINPCEICGKYGSHQIGTGWGIVVCKYHHDWYQAEIDRIKQEKTDDETVPDES